MSLNFSQIREVLSEKANPALHRSVIILAGEKEWQEESVKEILSGYEEKALWVSDNDSETYPSISINKAHSWLGREKSAVIFDANSKFDVNAFAAITGIVVGGGLFILLMPGTDKWDEVYLSYFGQRLVQSINTTSELNIIRQTDKLINFSPVEIKKTPAYNCIEPFLTFEQQHVVEVIEAEVRNKSFNPIVINSDRGRGKSAALGMAAARLVKSGINNIAITAPRYRSSEIIFKHIESLLPKAEITHGKVIYKNSIIQFYSPDQLISDDINVDIVFVDEAAAIPVPVLTTILHKYLYCVFASTVHGYEGTGRGFALRFNTVLNKEKPKWQKCLMNIPVRWAENDPLEKWMFNLLCLDAELVAPNSIGIIDSNKLEIICPDRSDIVKDTTLLKEIFALLVLAHYRTQPSDLQRLLDDDQISLYIAKYNQHVLAVALVNHEGSFPDALSTQVYRGERRPHGHLLAQALTYHCGVEHAATLNYSRLMRIAVHPDFQRQGIGSKLLDFIITNEKKHGCNAIGASFGMNASLLNFWRQFKFNVVRIGFKREQTSGEHAAIMLLPLNPQGEEVNDKATSRFIKQLPFWFEDVLRDIPSEIKKLFPAENEIELDLSTEDIKDLQSYIKYSRQYELCISAVSKFVLSNLKTIEKNTFPHDFREVLKLKVIEKKSWKELAGEINLSGKGEAQKYFHQAVDYLFESDQTQNII